MAESTRLLPRIDDTAVFDELKRGNYKVYLLHGLSGVGKTALTNKVSAELAEASLFDIHIKHVCASDGLTSSLQDWMIQDVAQKLLPPASLGAIRSVLEERIVEFCGATKTLLVIDNAEHLPMIWLSTFVKRWIEGTQNSLLLIIATRDVLAGLSLPTMHKRQLLGFAKEESQQILRILGDRLAARFDRSTLLSASDKLSRTPQYLLYLRWLDPKDSSALDDTIARITDGRFSIDDLWLVISSIEESLVHFYALGLTNKLEIEHGLLSFLWDVLGQGTIEKHRRVLDFLLKQGFLSRIAGQEEVYAIHPSLHIQLEKLLARSMGAEHITHVAYYLSVYFGRKMCQNNSIDLDAMQQFVLQAARAKNLLSGSTHLTRKPLVELTHRSGLSLGYKSVLLQALSSLDSQEPGKQQDAQELVVRSRLKLELARCECALSQYHSCLELLAALEDELPPCSSSAEDALYIRGIAEGCLGNSSASIAAYGRVVKLAIAKGSVGLLATESIGYLALVESFRDPNNAISLATQAMRFAREHRDHHLLAVSLCSAGQVMLYVGRRDEAGAWLDEAATLHSSGRIDSYDLREFGRLLVAQAMRHLVDGKGQEADLACAQAIEINRRVGDNRRLQRALMLQAVCMWSRGEGLSAVQRLQDALRTLSVVDDKFYGIAAGLIVSYIQGARSAEEALVELGRSDSTDVIDIKRVDHVILERIWVGIVQPIMSSRITDKTAFGPSQPAAQKQ